METTVITTITWRECPFKYHGKNLANYRRAELWQLASRDGINVSDANASKNDLLLSLIAFFKQLQSEEEVSELIDG